jgi:M6 family metalloprotease-like protein
MVQRVRQARLKMFGAGAPSAGPAASGFAIEGRKSIPVLTLKFSDTGSADPIDVKQLQTELFDGPWPTGTMTDYYKEISYGLFEVTGQVHPFKTLKNKGSFYTANCNGLCEEAKIPDMLTETLTLNGSIDWGQFDNEGPDGKPNSGDDDGFVDFVAFVQPDIGGECGKNPHVWSHRFSLSGWGAKAFPTKSPANGGGTIMIDDYVVMPSKACDAKTMIQIGVFAHEFGHAFGLPDLYDTDDDNGESEGAGNWCLMAGGSWGGDGNSPERPAHMSAWSKTFLGWVLPKLPAGNPSISLEDIESKAVALKVPISAVGTQYYLIENRQKTKFDDHLPIGGLLIWRINDSVVNAGLINNSVNADETKQGVELVEADGLSHLDSTTNRGDAGDPFPGSKNVRNLDNTTKPPSIGKVGVCEIGDAAPTMTIRLSLTGQCKGTTPPVPTPEPQSVPTAGQVPQKPDVPPATAGGTAPAQEPEAVTVTVGQLAKNPAAYVGKTLRVDGLLENAGRNYQTDLRLVLKERDGNESVRVVWPGVPKEVARPPAGTSRSRPSQASDFLGKTVEVIGVMEETVGRDGVRGFTLRIRSAAKPKPEK